MPIAIRLSFHCCIDNRTEPVLGQKSSFPNEKISINSVNRNDSWRSVVIYQNSNNSKYEISMYSN